ncbi:trehalose/maltose transport system permease protein [Stigmatella aurantiaca]|uniref:Trehalose/maltose transport system permease protein n=1 Tax=Stigmatella aurantiaca TaxID=41 RepID=A0A1H7JPI8_STIAU|nr:sugar ABC transporter permease [Stigmatella aurantiaca]SEK76529.1 trehalose/maltose transport system permease protein [Stigmatella aurantiaca]
MAHPATPIVPGEGGSSGPPEGASALLRERTRAAWLFLAPTLVVMLLVAGWPLARTFWFSFTDANLTDMAASQFVGLDSIRQVLDDPDWWTTVVTTFKFAGVSVFLETVLGMIIALALNAKFGGRGLLRAAVLVPWAIPTVVSARMWAWMFNDIYGVVNAIFMSVGLISEPMAWTAEPSLAFGAVVAVDVWKTTPFMTLLILAALQMLPGDVYEAARIDGAGPIRAFFQVTLPMLKGPLMVAIIFRILDALRVFDIFFVLTGGGTDTMPMAGYARQRMFEYQEIGVGSAAASLLFAIIAVFTALYMVVGRVKLGD